MGCGSSSGQSLSKLSQKDQLYVNAQLDAQSATLRALNLSREDGTTMFRSFDDMDKDASRSIDFKEFCWHFKIDRTKFAKRCFMLLDTEGSGQIDFGQFIICTWNFCTYDKAGLIAFAFTLYDTDSTGWLEMDKMNKIVHEVYDLHNKAKSGLDHGEVRESADVRVKKALQGIKKHMQGGRMSPMGFAKYVRTNQLVLWPAFKMQHILKSAIIGEKFWDRQQRKRRAISMVNGKRIDDPNNVKEIISAIFGMGVYQRQERFGEDNWFHEKTDEDLESKGPVVLVNHGKVRGLSASEGSGGGKLGKFAAAATLAKNKAKSSQGGGRRRSSKAGGEQSQERRPSMGERPGGGSGEAAGGGRGGRQRRQSGVGRTTSYTESEPELVTPFHEHPLLRFKDRRPGHVGTCGKCHFDVDARNGYRCRACSNFVLCRRCATSGTMVLPPPPPPEGT